MKNAQNGTNKTVNDDNMHCVTTPAKRMGDKIRKIREEKGISRQELSKSTGVSVEMIVHYENGHRKPKKEFLEKIADGLGVNVMAISEPELDSSLGCMYALFELEDRYGFHISEARGGGVSFDLSSVKKNEELYSYLYIWENVYITTALSIQKGKDIKEAMKEYNNWKWNFPKDIEKYDTDASLAMIEKTMSKLQEMKTQLLNQKKHIDSNE